ncbi:MAG TPA: dTDP-glucose 4,6-dehydratase [Candidatus Saccharimonadales bacterium]|nr:dTDP-glucose 4,6-dehydratase [Candidatus Saccharimonadales bacterium]
MRLLVTGGAGFIGSEFVRMTLREYPEDSVVVLDKLTYAGNERNLESVRSDPRFRFVRGDICDAAVVSELAAVVDVIVNFAAESHVDRSLEAPGQFILTDVFGTFVLMDAARAHGHQRFVQVSTDEVYGEVNSGLSVEGDPLQPRSPYSASKAGGELQIQAYRTSYGFPAIVTRGSNTYGPFQYPEKIIPLFITNAIDDRPLPIYGDGGAVRDYLFVEDHARGIDCALRKGVAGMDYNIGAGGETNGITVADTVLQLLGKPGTLKQFVRDRLGHDRRYALDSTRLSALGWSPTVTFDVGMERTVAWFVEHEEWWRPLKSGEFWEFYQRNYKPAVETPAS